jgi:hypothetical protein
VTPLKMNVIDERRKLLGESDVDLLRTLVKQVVEALTGQQRDIRARRGIANAHGLRYKVVTSTAELPPEGLRRRFLAPTHGT